MSLSFRSMEWLFPLAIALHNAEEAIWLPGWSKRTGRWHDPIAPGVFRFAIVILTALAFVLTGLSFESGRETVWTYLVFGYMAAMLANVLIPHIMASIATRSYMPGLATGMAVNLPVFSLLIVLALRQECVSGGKAAAYFAGMTGLLLLSIPAFFKLGKALNL